MNFAQLRNEGIRDDVLVGVNSLGFIETTPVHHLLFLRFLIEQSS